MSVKVQWSGLQAFLKELGSSPQELNTAGFAINPVAAFPHKTTFHEMAHIVLGHLKENQGLVDGTLSDSERTPKTLREVEAESVAYILCETLGLPGTAESRGYIQMWLKEHGGQEIPEKSAARIFKAADSILKAGQTKQEKVEV